MTVDQVPDAVFAAVLSSTDRNHQPGGDLMHIIPAPRVPLGEPDAADRQRACDRLSTVHGRQVSGGWAVEELAREYALCFAAGFDAGQRAAGVSR